MMSKFLRSCLLVAFALLLRPTDAAQPIAETAGTGQAARTTLVLATREPLPVPFATTRDLPKTLSIDPLTEGEIQRAREDIFASIQSRPIQRIEGIDGCMQWYFVRHGKSEPWQAFGFGREGRGLAKVNGALRTTKFLYAMVPKSVSSLLGMRQVQGTAGGGDMWIHTFEERPSYAQYLAARQADDTLAHDLSLGTRGADARYLQFGGSNQLKIAKSNANCTLLRARCRTYAFPVNKEAYWIGSITRNERNFAADYFTEPVATAPGLRLEIAIEDMCPFSREGVVEGPINTRMGGAEPGIRKYGIPGNASLRKALEPYVRAGKR